MKKLNPNIRIAEAADVGRRLGMLFTDAATLHADGALANTFSQLALLTDALTDAIQSDRTRSALPEANQTRSRALRNVEKLLAAYAIIAIEPLQTAGQRLNAIMAKYGKRIFYQNYTETSGLIEALLADLANPVAHADAATLPGVPQAIAALAEAQTAFNRQRTGYETAIAGQRIGPATRPLKVAIAKQVNATLIPYLHAMTATDPARYNPFAGAVAQAIADTNAAIADRRRGASKTTRTQPAADNN